MINISELEAEHTVNISKESDLALDHLLKYVCEKTLEKELLDDFIEMLRSLPLPYLSYFVSQMAERNHDAFVMMLDYISALPESDPKHSLMERCSTLEKMQILGRVFDAERVKKMISILEI